MISRLAKYKNMLTTKHLDLSDSNVIIIGPAKSVNEDLKDVDLKKFSAIVRMNNSIHTPVTYQGVPFYYHNIYLRNQQRNSKEALAGLVDKESLERCGVEIIVLVLYRWREVLRLIRKNIWIFWTGANVRIYIAGPQFAKKIRNRIFPHKPTIGFIAIHYLLGANPNSLHLAGFTFFQTKYLDNYNNTVKTDNDALIWATRNGKHNPIAELHDFREIYEGSMHSCVNITISPSVWKAIYGIDGDF